MVLSNVIFFLTKIFCFVIIIYIIHQGWEFIKNNYSVPKKKNVFSSEVEKYKQIIQSIQEGSPPSHPETDILFEDKETISNMNSELEEFMKEEMIKITQ
jgi:predicted negative regulator of RcsB-dependent stress response